MRGSKVGAGMSRERSWGVPGAESEGQAFFPIPEGEWGGWGLNWGRGSWREAHLREEAGLRVGIREEWGEPSAGLTSGYRSPRVRGKLGWGEREGS